MQPEHIVYPRRFAYLQELITIISLASSSVSKPKTVINAMGYFKYHGIAIEDAKASIQIFAPK